MLKQLGNRLPKVYIPVFFDLQGRTHTTLDRFLWWLARETVRVLKQERGVDFPLPDRENFSKDLEFFENSFLPSLTPFLGDSCLLFTFDEFDNLEESEVREELARPLTDYLRRLMSRGDMNFIFSIGSSGRKLENMQAEYTEFFKTALYKKISFLSRDQTQNLVTRPVSGVIEYEPSAVDRIFAITSGHPYFTQLTCHELFARCQRTDQRVIATEDVEAILDDVVERGTVNLKFVWDEAADIERWSLAALANLEKTDNRSLVDFLKSHHVRFNDSELNAGLLHLREKDVITNENRFVIHLLKLWLQKNRTIDQVREELTEVNPIANRYIEIGVEFKNAGMYEKAVGSFREALNIAPENIQAQVNIALVYMAQNAHEKAIVEFERALKIDDEDVAARSGLCDAHLALGDTAMQRGRTKDAVKSYLRVLSINAEHTEARQRMAELSTQRAEKALANGRDEEALSAFSEALGYTPEDARLIDRVEKVREKKRAKVLAEQVVRAEKEIAARSWEDAIAALNEALETSSGDAGIRNQIELVKEQQLKEQLDSILEGVDLAEKSGRWDSAINGLNDYLQLKPDDKAVKKRIKQLMEAKHSAWIRAVLERVDQAVSLNQWDEAQKALQEALLLEPENQDLKTRAELLAEDRKAAELEALLDHSGESAEAARWDEAIEILNGGLISFPENETLKTRLAEARKARRDLRLQAALRLVDSAVQQEKWETAVDSLQEVLANEPDNADFLNKLAAVRKLEHESRLKSLRSQAQSLLKQERFDESLTAWDEYLTLKPEDPEKAMAEVEAVRKAKTLASLYAEAAAEYTRKNYDAAVDLFKKIVVEDPDYKDATDLLAESVHLRRSGKKSPTLSGRKILAGGGVLAAAALVIGGVFWLGKNGLPSIFTPVLTADTPTEANAAMTPDSDAGAPAAAQEHSIVVTSAEDSGPGTLRQALLDAQSGDTITFDAATFPPQNPAQIRLTSLLPEITQGNLTVDASDAGVILNGWQVMPRGGDGIHISSDNNTIRGLQVQFFPAAGIWIGDGARDNVIGGNRETGSGLIGQGNMVGGNNGGIFLGKDSSNNTIEGNFVGVNAYDRYGFGNDGIGIQLDYAHHNLITGNVIAHNAEAGVYICCTAEGGNVVKNNIIGMNAAGDLELGNGTGIILDRTGNNVIGPDNAISNNHGAGIELWEDAFINKITRNKIHGNKAAGIVISEEYPAPDYYPAPPAILYFDHDTGMAAGQACANCTVEIFSNEDQGGKYYEGSASAHEFGNFIFTKGSPFTGPYLTATVTNSKPTTSIYSPQTPAVSNIQIALDAIQSQAPTFQTGFDDMENGKLQINNPIDYTGVDITKISSNIFAVEFDVQMLTFGEGGHCIQGITGYKGSGDKVAISLEFHKDGIGALSHYVPEIDNHRPLAEFVINRNEVNSFRFIMIEDDIAAFLNSRPVYSLKNPDGNVTIDKQDLVAAYIMCDFDNYKIWDLSGVDFNPGEPE